MRLLIEASPNYSEHVIDNYEITSLYISELVLFEATVHQTKAPRGNREDDIIDFALLDLTDELKDKIGSIEYINEKYMLIRGLSAVEKSCLALGCPNTKSKLNCRNGNKLKETPFV